jgi:hypothetical protein
MMLLRSFAFLAASCCLLADDWRPVRGGILGGISDLALVERTADHSTFIIVHDNKALTDPRAALITVSGPKPVAYQPLEWQLDPECIDLESISAVPGRPGEFLALISRGIVYHIRLRADHKAVETVGRFTLPDLPPDLNFEGLCIQRLDGRFLLAWADRGADERPARLYFGELQLDGYKISQVQSTTIRVPWPTQNVRHVSEMKVDEGGVLFVAAASDPGDDGPFASAIYLGGVFSFEQQKLRFKPHPQLLRVRTFADHKIEGMELVPGNGGIIFATDDENFGGWVLYNW